MNEKSKTNQMRNKIIHFPKLTKEFKLLAV